MTVNPYFESCWLLSGYPIPVVTRVAFWLTTRLRFWEWTRRRTLDSDESQLQGSRTFFGFIIAMNSACGRRNAALALRDQVWFSTRFASYKRPWQIPYFYMFTRLHYAKRSFFIVQWNFRKNLPNSFWGRCHTTAEVEMRSSVIVCVCTL